VANCVNPSCQPQAASITTVLPSGSALLPREGSLDYDDAPLCYLGLVSCEIKDDKDIYIYIYILFLFPNWFRDWSYQPVLGAEPFSPQLPWLLFMPLQPRAGNFKDDKDIYIYIYMSPINRFSPLCIPSHL
jgi:hypothetical protein